MATGSLLHAAMGGPSPPLAQSAPWLLEREWHSRAFCQLPAPTRSGKTRFQPALSYNLYITWRNVLRMSAVLYTYEGSHSTTSV